MAKATPTVTQADPRERAVLVGLCLGGAPRHETEASLAELAHLAEAAGAVVVGEVMQERQRPDAATLIGKGKAEEVARLADQAEAGLVLFDGELTPAQQRNLEKVAKVKTLDRTQLILDIFARRARTHEGRLQVELAQLGYLLPRLAGQGVMLSRLGGGIGTRGPGETKLETDRRRIRTRIAQVKREIERVRRGRHTQRGARQRAEVPQVALVGYTSAGKSTLFNALTRAGAPVSSQLFMTLDPLARRTRLGDAGEVVVVDTVGFIQKLPHTLVAAFRATLEEVVEADLLLHVIDAAAEDLEAREAAVAAVLNEIGAGDVPRVAVLNKVDLVPVARREGLLAAHAGGVAVSALRQTGIEALHETIARRLELEPKRVRLGFDPAEGRAIAALYRVARVLGHEVEEGEVRIEALLPARWLTRYQGRMR
ncbi:MAG: GTPase HflX [Vicinamibacteria bacterium]|nr:GTPase HflX [Vicinamibacteria bacterium]